MTAPMPSNQASQAAASSLAHGTGQHHHHQFDPVALQSETAESNHPVSVPSLLSSSVTSASSSIREQQRRRPSAGLTSSQRRRSRLPWDPRNTSASSLRSSVEAVFSTPSSELEPPSTANIQGRRGYFSARSPDNPARPSSVTTSLWTTGLPPSPSSSMPSSARIKSHTLAQPSASNALDHYHDPLTNIFTPGRAGDSPSWPLPRRDLRSSRRRPDAFSLFESTASDGSVQLPLRPLLGRRSAQSSSRTSSSRNPPISDRLHIYSSTTSSPSSSSSESLSSSCGTPRRVNHRMEEEAIASPSLLLLRSCGNSSPNLTGSSAASSGDMQSVHPFASEIELPKISSIRSAASRKRALRLFSSDYAVDDPATGSSSQPVSSSSSSADQLSPVVIPALPLHRQSGKLILKRRGTLTDKHKRSPVTHPMAADYRSGSTPDQHHSRPDLELSSAVGGLTQSSLDSNRAGLEDRLLLNDVSKSYKGHQNLNQDQQSPSTKHALQPGVASSDKQFSAGYPMLSRQQVGLGRIASRPQQHQSSNPQTQMTLENAQSFNVVGKGLLDSRVLGQTAGNRSVSNGQPHHAAADGQAPPVLVPGLSLPRDDDDDEDDGEDAELGKPENLHSLHLSAISMSFDAPTGSGGGVGRSITNSKSSDPTFPDQESSTSTAANVSQHRSPYDLRKSSMLSKSDSLAKQSLVHEEANQPRELMSRALPTSLGSGAPVSAPIGRSRRRSLSRRPRTDARSAGDSTPPKQPPSSSSSSRSLSDSLALLNSDDWEDKVAGLEVVTRIASSDNNNSSASDANLISSSALEGDVGRLGQVVNAVLVECRNLRSQVARQAVQTLTVLLSNRRLACHLDGHVEACVRVLLNQAGQSGAVFLRDQVTAALDALTNGVSPMRSIPAFIQHGAEHKNQAVRQQTALQLANIVSSRLDIMSGANFGSGRPADTANTFSSDSTPSSCFALTPQLLDRLVTVLSRWLTDGNQLTRYHGRRILSCLTRHTDFERTVQRQFTGQKLLVLREAIDLVKSKGVGDPPSIRQRGQSPAIRNSSLMRGSSRVAKPRN